MNLFFVQYREYEHGVEKLENRKNQIEARRKQVDESFQFYSTIATMPPEPRVVSATEKKINAITNTTLIGASVGAGFMAGGILLGPVGFPLILIGSFVSLTHVINGSIETNKVSRANTL